MIHLSPTAIAEIKRLKARQKDSPTFCRISAVPGGCAEYYYQLGFEAQMTTGDRLFDCDDIQVISDDTSLAAIAGLTIDYSEDLMGGGFRFHNPNASSNCGCGNSFNLTPKG